MSFKPIIIDQGQFKQLPAGESIDCGGWFLPASSGDQYQLIQAGISGNTHWSTDLIGLTSLTVDNISINGALITSDTGTINFYDDNIVTLGNITGDILTAKAALWVNLYLLPSPTAANQIDISSAANTSNWVTAGNNKVLASNDTGIISWENKSFGYSIPANASANQVYVGTGVGTAAWTTDLIGLTSLTVDNISINDSQITSLSNTISFDNDHLTTTGNISSGTVTSSGAFIATDTGGNHVYRTAYIWEGPYGNSTGTLQIILPKDWCNCMLTFRIRGFNWASGGAWEALIGGYPHATISSWGRYGAAIRGANVPFNSIRLGRNTAAGKVCILLGTTSTLWTYPGFEIDISAQHSNESGWDGGYSTSIITSESGITDLVTCSLSRDIECQTVADKVLLSDVDKTFSWYTTSLADALKKEVPNTAGKTVKWALAADTSGLFEIVSAPWPVALDADETLYIRTTGNDANSGKTVATALLTIGEGIKRLFMRSAGQYKIIMDIGEGVYTLTSSISPAYPYGANVEWRGFSESHTGVAVSNIGAVTVAAEAGLSYINFDVTLPVGKTTAVNNFIMVTSASGGTNPHLVTGCHEVTAWNSGTRVATVKCYRRTGVTPVPSGAITVDITVVKTVLYFSGSTGLQLTGPFHSGTWGKSGYGIIFKGDYTHNGLWALNGATIILGTDAGSSRWGINLYAQNGSVLFADSTYHSCGGTIAKVQNTSIINLRGESILTGAKTFGVNVFIDATVAMNSAHIYTCGSTNGIRCRQGAFVDFSSGILKDGLGVGIDADTGGGVDATGAINNYTIPTDTHGGDGAVYT